MHHIKIIELEQIYNFIAEYPEIGHSNNIDRILTFINTYRNDKPELKICNLENLLHITFHNSNPIKFDIKTLPNFLHKQDFLAWCYQNILY